MRSEMYTTPSLLQVLSGTGRNTSTATEMLGLCCGPIRQCGSSIQVGAFAQVRGETRRADRSAPERTRPEAGCIGTDAAATQHTWSLPASSTPGFF